MRRSQPKEAGGELPLSQGLTEQGTESTIMRQKRDTVALFKGVVDSRYQLVKAL